MSVTPRFAWAADEKADYTLRIGTGLVELAPEHIVSTTLYNDQFPGPLLRFKQGQRVVVDVHNDTDTTLFVKISLVAGGGRPTTPTDDAQRRALSAFSSSLEIDLSQWRSALAGARGRTPHTS
jgi:Multicopper oxidase